MNRQRQIGDIRRALSESIGLEEVRDVVTFKAYRGDDRVTVEIQDRGPDWHLPESRYVCVATTEDGRVATGNGGGTPTDAILTTHWEKLDR